MPSARAVIRRARSAFAAEPRRSRKVEAVDVSATTSAVSPRGVVALTYSCTNACVFCAQAGLDLAAPSDAEVSAALRRARADARDVTFVGGEPGTIAALEQHVADARALGFEHIGVQTNGSGLDDPRRLHALAAAGLSHLHLSVHGERAVHDYHTGVFGSFDRVGRVAAAARAAGMELVVNTVLTRSSFRTLDALVPHLVTLRVAAWCVSVPVVAGRAESGFDRLVPRLGLALPFALRALALARGHGIAVYIAGAPLCLLGPFGADALEVEPRAFVSACDACRARAVCPGVDAAYLERFDGDELAPRATLAQPAPARAEWSWAHAFPGVGRVAPARRAPAAEPSPARARRALPMLGRGQPARAEVARGTEKRTGAALRGLFPTLFEQPSPVADTPSEEGESSRPDSTASDATPANSDSDAETGRS